MIDKTEMSSNSLTSDYCALLRIFQKRQSIRYYTKEKPERTVIEEIVCNARYAPNSCNLQHYGFIYVDDDEVLARLEKVASRKVAWAPALVVIIDDKRFSLGRGAGLQSVAAAVMNIILSATAKGLGTCWMAGFAGDVKIRKILDIPDHFEVTGLMAIGYPKQDTSHRPTVRMKTEEFLHINRFEKKQGELIPDLDVRNWNMEKLVSYRERIGSVYAPRKRIRLYNTEMIADAADRLSEKLVSLNKEVSLLDYASYEGNFARALSEVTGYSTLACSDFSPYFLKLIENQFPSIKSILLDPKFKKTAPDCFDVVSLIFKAEFLPDIEIILKDMKKHLSSDGYGFVTTVTTLSPRAIFYKVRNHAKNANIYEKNRLYMFGPYRHRCKITFEKAFKATGWEVVESGRGGKWPWTDYDWWWIKSTSS